MTDEILSPVAVETAIRDVANRIANGVKVCSDRYNAFLTADREYDRAFAVAYMAHKGAAHERKYAAEIETQDARKARDDADGLYRYADRQHRALQDELRAYQSVGASIRQMFAVAGRGEGA